MRSNANIFSIKNDNLFHFEQTMHYITWLVGYNIYMDNKVTAIGELFHCFPNQLE